MKQSTKSAKGGARKSNPKVRDLKPKKNPKGGVSKVTKLQKLMPIGTPAT